MRGKHVRLSWVPVLLLALVLVGCGLASNGDGEPDTAPTPTTEVMEPSATPTETTLAPTATQPPVEPTEEVPLVYGGVDVSDAGLTFEVPDSWIRLEPEWTWAPEPDAGLQIGVNWLDLEPPQEAEAAMLPSPSEVVSSEPIDLAFGSGRRVVINVLAPATEGGDAQAPVESTQIHVLITLVEDDTRRAYDFYAVGHDGDQLAVIDPVLQHMLDSAALASSEVGGAGDQIPEGVTKAIAILADLLGTSEDAVELVSFEAAEWGDACLGIHTPGIVCAQVITPGYRVILSANSTQYELHTNQSGSSVGIVP